MPDTKPVVILSGETHAFKILHTCYEAGIKAGLSETEIGKILDVMMDYSATEMIQVAHEFFRVE